eukprot:gb/GFBE01076444.1/.p1 GENE.gb/GFBE01076444.1/~~gb/GFBE01076444.1/.p1  ORF type:complete len:186 (+),score=25.04 gb/GFBE01076444.1/:1-558(+)
MSIALASICCAAGVAVEESQACNVEAPDDRLTVATCEKTKCESAAPSKSSSRKNSKSTPEATITLNMDDLKSRQFTWFTSKSSSKSSTTYARLVSPDDGNFSQTFSVDEHRLSFRRGESPHFFDDVQATHLVSDLQPCKLPSRQTSGFSSDVFTSIGYPQDDEMIAVIPDAFLHSADTFDFNIRV